MILPDWLKQRKRGYKKAPERPLNTILTPHKPYREAFLWLTFWQKYALPTDTPIYSSALFRFSGDRKKTFQWSCEQNDNCKPCFLLLFATIPGNGRIRTNLRIVNLTIYHIVKLFFGYVRLRMVGNADKSSFFGFSRAPMSISTVSTPLYLYYVQSGVVERENTRCDEGLLFLHLILTEINWVVGC